MITFKKTRNTALTLIMGIALCTMWDIQSSWAREGYSRSGGEEHAMPKRPQAMPPQHTPPQRSHPPLTLSHSQSNPPRPARPGSGPCKQSHNLSEKLSLDCIIKSGVSYPWKMDLDLLYERAQTIRSTSSASKISDSTVGLIITNGRKSDDLAVLITNYQSSRLFAKELENSEQYANKHFAQDANKAKIIAEIERLKKGNADGLRIGLENIKKILEEKKLSTIITESVLEQLPNKPETDIKANKLICPILTIAEVVDFCKSNKKSLRKTRFGLPEELNGKTVDYVVYTLKKKTGVPCDIGAPKLKMNSGLMALATKIGQEDICSYTIEQKSLLSKSAPKKVDLVVSYKPKKNKHS